MAINKDKYQNAISYLCSKLKGEIRGKKKLAKLLYFVDFDLYESAHRSLTGDVYHALPMGPVPLALEQITAEMAGKNLLMIEPVTERDGYNPTEVYRSLTEPDMNAFDAEERSMLDRVAAKYGGLNGRQLEELSHAEAPYKGTILREAIPYELAYYRGTDFEEA